MRQSDYLLIQKLQGDERPTSICLNNGMELVIYRSPEIDPQAEFLKVRLPKLNGNVFDGTVYVPYDAITMVVYR